MPHAPLALITCSNVPPGVGHTGGWAERYGWHAMNQSRTTLLITLTGRDRPGVTARLFGALARFPLSVADIEQVTIRGRLVLGVLVTCTEPPDLTAIYGAVSDLAADFGLEAEITTGSAESPARAGSARIRGRRRQHRPHHQARQRPGDLRRARRVGGRPGVTASRAGPGGGRPRGGR